MAVTQRSKPIVKMTAINDELPGEKRIARLHWYSKTATAGDDLLVVDEDGDIVWEEVALAADYLSVEHIINNPIKGLKISAIDTGVLYVVMAPKYPSRYW